MLTWSNLKNVVIFGYGSQGHAHAANLRDSGVKNVRIALRADSPTNKSKRRRSETMTPDEAAKWADVIMMATPGRAAARHLLHTVRRIFISSGSRWDDGISIGMGNNPMVGATVAVAVSVQQAADAGKF